MIVLDLPHPPSVNHTHRKVRGRVILSEGARKFRKDVCEALAAAGTPRLDGPLAVVVEVFPPGEKQPSDIDNVQKALLDALQAGGLFENDSQIVRLTIERRAAVRGGAAIVRVERAR